MPTLSFIDSLEAQQRKTFIANDGLVLTSACPDKEIGTKMIEFLTSGESMARYHEEIREPPPVATDEEPDPDDPFADIYADLDLMQGLPINANGISAYNALYQNLQQVIIGQKTPEQALADAARIDGASDKKIFLSIVVPLVRPVIVALTVFTFLTTWNDFLWPLVSITDEEMQTLTLAAANLQGQFTTDYGLVMAGATMTFLFPLVLYVVLQRRFVEGVVASGMKG